MFEIFIKIWIFSSKTHPNWRNFQSLWLNFNTSQPQQTSCPPRLHLWDPVHKLNKQTFWQSPNDIENKHDFTRTQRNPQNSEHNPHKCLKIHDYGASSGVLKKGVPSSEASGLKAAVPGFDSAPWRFGECFFPHVAHIFAANKGRRSKKKTF